MKKFISVFFLTISTLICANSSLGDPNIYQVITAHPHDVKELYPYIETASVNGRLWFVRLKSSAPQKIKRHLRLLSGEEKSYYYSRKSNEGQKISKSQVILSLMKMMRKENIRRDVVQLSGYKTRYAGTTDNQEALKNLAARLYTQGYEIQEICYRAGACSIVAERKGNRRPQDVLMVMAHIDSVGKDFAGADDNASGTAVLMEMAKVLKDYENSSTIRFFITNGEELGLLGARHYVEKLTSENKLKEFKLVINMDMVGYNSNGIVELETDPRFENLARWFAELAGLYTNLQSKVTLGAWGSDHVPFLNKGVPTLLTIEDWSTKTPCYHQSCDKAETLNYDYALEIGKLNLSAILTKDRH